MVKKKGSRFMSFLLAALVVVTAVPVNTYASSEGEVAVKTTTTDTETQSTESVPTGKVGIVPESMGGVVRVQVKDESGEYSVDQSVSVSESGNYHIKDNLTQVESTVESQSPEYPIMLEKEIGTLVEVSVDPEDGYDVSTYRILSDSGEVLSNVDIEEVKENGYSQSLTIPDGVKVVSVGFEAVSSKEADEESTEDNLDGDAVQENPENSESTKESGNEIPKGQTDNTIGKIVESDSEKDVKDESKDDADNAIGTVEDKDSAKKETSEESNPEESVSADFGITPFSAGWPDIGAAPNTHIVPRGFTVDGDYAFCPTITDATTITYGGANWDNVWCQRAQANLNIVKRYWPEADVVNWSNVRSINAMNSANKGRIYVDYKNVGEYLGEQVNMRLVLADWALYDNIPKDDYPHFIITTGYGDGYPVVNDVCVKWVEVRFEYYRNDGSPVNLKGHYTMNDLDFYQGFKVVDNGSTVALYTNQDAANRMGYDSAQGIIWVDETGTTPDNDNGWVTYLFNGSNTVMRFYVGSENPRGNSYQTYSNCALWGSLPPGVETNHTKFYKGATSTWVTEDIWTTWMTSEFGYYAEASINFSSKANVQVTKVDSETNEKLSGATFTCYEWNGSGWKGIGNLAWNSASGYYYKNGLERNSTNNGRFRVVETASPSNYTGSWSQEFTISQEGTVTLKYTAQNSRKKGTITINKTDAENGNKINGAEFQVIAANDIRTVGGTVLIRKGTVVQTLTVSNGTAKSKELDFGQYTVKETKAAPGYVLSGSSQNVTVSEGNANVSVSFTNKPIKVRLDLYKTGSNTDLTNGNQNYSLAGAVYSIYTDSACRNLYATMTTDGSGHAFKDNMPLGVYYVKETTAPNGYQLDSTVHRVDMSNQNELNYRLDVKDTPFSDPVTTLLKKVDSDTSNGSAEQGASLEGAQFEVKFYDERMDTDPAAAGLSPLRRWVFKTVTTPSGTTLVNYSPDCLVSGDPLYYQGNVASLPYGTITIKEIVAPNGYHLNPTTFVVKIGDTLTIAPVYHEPEIPNNSIDFTIVKKQSGTEYRIPGVTFEHRRPDGSTERVTTNDRGEIKFKGLTVGDHVVKEVATVDGFALNTQEIRFTVNRDGSIKVTSTSTPSDTNGNYTVTVDGSGDLQGVVENKPAPFDLHIYKINNHDFALQGAEFTLYSDAACKAVVDKQTTDSSGNLTFRDLIVGKTYYMKETKAPQGYRIPVNDDGSDIIWKISTESYPTEGIFYFYVNDKRYDANSNGSYYLTGSVADRVANMVVVNEVGLRLPTTGSNGMLVVVAIGLALIGGGLLISRKRKVE